MNQQAFDIAVSELENAPSLRMKSLRVSSPIGDFRYDFTPAPAPTDLRSISKLAVSLAIGVAISLGTRIGDAALSLDMPIAPHFERFAKNVPPDSSANFTALRLRHLLSNTMGHRNGFLFRKDVQDREPSSLLRYIFAKRLDFRPGTHFSYSNVGWYLVSVMVKDELGISLGEWATRMLFSKLKIDAFSWVRYGQYEAAATGLSLDADDVHKMGQLLLEDGNFQGIQVVPRGWTEDIRRPVVKASSGYDASSPLQATAYGYGIWTCDDGTYYCDGSGGQFLIIVPERRLVITALTEEGDTLTVSRCLQGYLRA